MENHENLCIYSYDDYRTFVRDWFYRSKAANKRVSLAFVGRQLGVSKMHVKYILDGKRHLTPRFIPVLIKTLKLEKREAEYFRHLVMLSRAADFTQRMEHLQHLLRLRQEAAGTEITETAVAAAPGQVVHHWLVPVVAAMHRLEGAESHPKWIQENMSIRASENEIEEAMRQMAWDSHNAPHMPTIQRTSSDSGMPAGFRRLIERHHALKHAVLGTQVFDKDESANGNLIAMTCPVSEEGAERIQELIAELQRKIAAEIASTTSASRVVQINLQMYQLNRLRTDSVENIATNEEILGSEPPTDQEAFDVSQGHDLSLDHPIQ